ncbi:hypothetical protein YC2023_099066 [Brassica napus]
MTSRRIFVVLRFDWMCEADGNFLCGVILDFGIFSLSDLMGVEILRAVVILEDQFLGGSGQIRYYGNVSPRLEVKNEELEIGTTDQDVVAVGDTPAKQEIPVVQEQEEVEEETKLAEERSLLSQALDEANLMVDGVLLSDSELLLEEGDDQEDWEQGEIMDFTEEELAA